MDAREDIYSIREKWNYALLSNSILVGRPAAINPLITVAGSTCEEEEGGGTRLFVCLPVSFVNKSTAQHRRDTTTTTYTRIAPPSLNRFQLSSNAFHPFLTFKKCPTLYVGAVISVEFLFLLSPLGLLFAIPLVCTTIDYRQVAR